MGPHFFQSASSAFGSRPRTGWNCGSISRTMATDATEILACRRYTEKPAWTIGRIELVVQFETPNRRRSHRLSLQVEILLQARMASGECVQGRAFTSAVNAHGGLLGFPLKLQRNQRIQITNPHSGKEVSCTVVHVEGPHDGYYEVAFEFDRPNPSFWQIEFAPEDWSVSKSLSHE